LSPREQLTFNGWSMDGWVRWLAGLRGVYERRMNRMCTILDAHSFQLKQSTPLKESDADWGVITKTRIMSFDWARGGMFLWLRIWFEHHPLWQTKGERVALFDGPKLATAWFILLTHKPHLVLGAPGSMFSANTSIAAERGWRHMRLCFAAEAEENIEPLAVRFGLALQKFWRIKTEEMENLIEEFDVQGLTLDDVENAGYYSMGC
jgi:DNA-binding transcriptional MocR family regulator